MVPTLQEILRQEGNEAALKEYNAAMKASRLDGEKDARGDAESATGRIAALRAELDDAKTKIAEQTAAAERWEKKHKDADKALTALRLSRNKDAAKVHIQEVLGGEAFKNVQPTTKKAIALAAINSQTEVEWDGELAKVVTFDGKPLADFIAENGLVDDTVQLSSVKGGTGARGSVTPITGPASADIDALIDNPDKLLTMNLKELEEADQKVTKAIHSGE